MKFTFEDKVQIYNERKCGFTISQLIEVEKLKVAAYARVLTEKDEQHNSLEAQKDYFFVNCNFKLNT